MWLPSKSGLKGRDTFFSGRRFFCVALQDENDISNFEEPSFRIFFAAFCSPRQASSPKNYQRSTRRAIEHHRTFSPFGLQLHEAHHVRPTMFGQVLPFQTARRQRRHRSATRLRRSPRTSPTPPICRQRLRRLGTGFGTDRLFPEGNRLGAPVLSGFRRAIEELEMDSVGDVLWVWASSAT